MVAKVGQGRLSADRRTVEEQLVAWLDHIGPHRSPTTIRTYRDVANRIVIPAIGSIEVRSLTARHLDTLRAKVGDGSAEM